MNQIIHQVRLISQNDTSGHDWWHIQRVVNLAMYIGRRENADLRLVQLGALLHDLDDWKFNECGADQPIARRVMAENGIEAAIANRVISIISEVSFKGAGVDTTPTSLEAKVVQDADRLDAIGAIGVARAFAYGGYAKQPMHTPDLEPSIHGNFEEYKSNRTSTINHFYEKLLLLKDRLNTHTARELAVERHQFMEQFLEQFFHEWEFMG
jgi:uncharacterized protein